MNFTNEEIRHILITKDRLKSIIARHDILRNVNYYPQGYIVFAGGYFASDLNDDLYQDIDIFVLDGRQDIFNYLSFKNELVHSDIWKYNNNVQYLKNPHVLDVATNKMTKDQIILTDYKSRKELLEHFDMLHCTASYVPDEDKLYITRGAYDSILSKILVRHNGNSAADWRINKFISRGWKIQSAQPYKSKTIPELLAEGVKAMYGKTP